MEFKRLSFANQKTLDEFNKKYDISKLKLEVKEKLLKDNYVKEFLNKTNLPMEIFDKNMSSFIQCVEDNKVCANCKGLSSCLKQLKGYKTIVDYDRPKTINLAYSPCAYKLEYDKQANNYLYHDFNDDWMLSKIEDIVLNNARKSVIKAVTSVLEGRSKSFYLFGKQGLGKSFLLATLCNEFINITNKKVAFINTRKMVEKLRGIVFAKDNETYERIKDELKSVDLLVFDDLGAEKITDWSKEDVLYDILEARVQSELITLFSSEFSMNELKELYGNDLKNRRLVNIIANHSDEIELVGVKIK